MFPLLRSFKGFPSKNRSAFTLTELIVVITILSILSVIGFVVMSHQSSVARDGKRISDIQTLSQSAKITSAQLRLLPTPIADSIALSVSGTFIGYQGFMSESLVNPLGYGSDKIYDPKDNIPYTYRVNQYFDRAQFMAYLENPRFERSIEIAKNQFLRNEEVGMNGFGGLFDSVVSRAYALDTSDSDLAKRYPYAAGDKLGIFLRKDSNAPIQSGVNGTGSQSISTLDNSTLRILVSEDTYLGSISTGALLSLKDGSFDEKALLAMNSSTSGSGGSGSGGGSGNNSSSGYVLTMGEYIFEGEPLYGYVGPGFLSGPYASYITTITAGDLTPKTIDGKVIDSILFLQGQQLLLMEDGSGISDVVVSEGSQNSNCINGDVIGSIQLFGCESVSIVGPYTVGEMRTLGIKSTDGSCPTTPTDESYFTFDSSNGTITGYSNLGPKQVMIPSTIGGVNVVNIGDLAFMNKSLTCVNIPNGVTHIGDLAFYINQLTSVTIANSVTNIGFGAFNRNNLSDSDAFIYARNPDGSEDTSTIIGYGGAQRDNIVIPNSVTSIGGENAFYGNQITSVTIPSSVVSLGTGAFAGNQLTSVIIPNSITNVGTGAFSTNQLTSVTIPNSVTNIGRSAFFNNQLTSITIGDSVISIGLDAFKNNQLTSVTIPNSVTNIDYGAFANQTNSLGNGTVYGPASGYVKDTYTNNSNSEFDKDKLPNYSDVLGSGGSVCPGNNPTDESYFTFNSSNGAITGYSINGPKDVVIPCVIGGVSVVKIEDSAFYNKQLTSVVIPDGVTRIGMWAFYNNQLTSVTIPDSVTRIDQGAFYRNQLTSMTIPAGVTSIGAQTFTWNQLTSVTIPDGVIAIGDEAFYRNQLTSVTIPAGVTSIGYRAFGMNQLTSVTIPDGVTSIGDSAFISNQLTSVTIPAGVISIGGSAFFSNQLTSVNIPNGVTNIGDWTFAQNLLASVTIPDGVTNIGSHAFYENHFLISVTIPNSVVSIGDYAFAGTSLISVTIPNSVVSIGDYAFAGTSFTSVTIPSSVVTIGMGTFAYSSLTSVTIPNSIVSIGNEAFYRNQLTSVTIPNSMTNIGNHAFFNNQLTSVNIPNSVTSIGEGTFADNQLTSVTIGNSVVSIGYQAFVNNQLTSVTIPNSVTSIGSYAFQNQTNSTGNGTIYGPSSGYVKNTYTSDNTVFDKIKLPNYVDQ